MAYRDYYMEVAGTIPTLGVPAAQKYLQRAWKEIQDRHLWSWLVEHMDVLSPAIISTGTVEVTQGSADITFDADAIAVLDIAGLNPPVAGAVGTGRQLRIGSGPLYTILTYDAGAATLDRAYAEATNTAASYQCYKCLYSLPTGALRYVLITNTTTGYAIYGPRLYKDQRLLNSGDPLRGSSGDAYCLSPVDTDSDGQTVFEWYPHPTNAAVYHCVYRKRWLDLTEDTGLPASLDESVLIERALALAGQWAMSNVGKIQDLSAVNWVNFVTLKNAEFNAKLKTAIRQDNEMNPLLPLLRRYARQFGVIGGQFAQTHDLSGWLLR